MYLINQCSELSLAYLLCQCCTNHVWGMKLGETGSLPLETQRSRAKIVEKTMTIIYNAGPSHDSRLIFIRFDCLWGKLTSPCL